MIFQKSHVVFIVGMVVSQGLSAAAGAGGGALPAWVPDCAEESVAHYQATRDALNRVAADPKRVLGIPADASYEQCKAAFRLLALRYHPDKAPTSESEVVFNDITKMIIDAYSVMKVSFASAGAGAVRSSATAAGVDEELKKYYERYNANQRKFYKLEREISIIREQFDSVVGITKKCMEVLCHKVYPTMFNLLRMRDTVLVLFTEMETNQLRTLYLAIVERIVELLEGNPDYLDDRSLNLDDVLSLSRRILERGYLSCSLVFSKFTQAEKTRLSSCVSIMERHIGTWREALKARLTQERVDAEYARRLAYGEVRGRLSYEEVCGRLSYEELCDRYR